MADELSLDDYSRDEILRGRLRLWQPREGYRFAVDPLLLVDFALRSDEPPGAGGVCDLGSGCGVVALALARACATATVTAVELQPRLAMLARRNAVENGLDGRVSVVEADLGDERAAKEALAGASCRWVLTNPPYRTVGEGPACPDEEEAVARHEVKATIAQWLAQARRLLVQGGRCAVVYPAERLVALLTTMESEGLRPVRLQMVHPRPGKAAGLVLVEGRKGAKGGVRVEPPLFVLDGGGSYSAAARRALGET